MWFATKADINVGVITSIWSINPLFLAVMDYFIFQESLKYYHLVGTIFMVLCALSISMTGSFDPIF